MITIDTQHLTAEECRQAEYLAALAEFREAQTRAWEDLRDKKSVDMTVLDQLRERVTALAPDWRETAIDAGEAKRRFRIPRQTLNWLARSGRIRAEKRGRSWYYCADDLEIIKRDGGDE